MFREPGMQIDRLLRRSLRANEAAGIIYLNNPKVACSTVKGSLWKAISPDTYTRAAPVHDLAASPLTNRIKDPGWVQGARIFTFVRNPYARIVSAYANKIQRRSSDAWGWFVKRYGVDPERDLSFAEFLEIISGDDARDLDPHWRPQYINTLHPFVEPNFTGFLEHMDEDLPRVFSGLLGYRDFAFERHARHRTGADARVVEMLADPWLKDRVEALYERDFDYFGYSRNPAMPAPLSGRAEITLHEHPALRDLVALSEAGSHIRNAGLVENVSDRARRVGDITVPAALNRSARRPRRPARRPAYRNFAGDSLPAQDLRFVFLFCPNNSGSTVLSQYAAKQLNAYLPPFGNNEGQMAPRVKKMMRARPWRAQTEFDWRFIRKEWERLAGGAVFVEASPPNIMRAGPIADVFGAESTAILSICDPYQQIASCLRRYRGPGTNPANLVGQWLLKARKIRGIQADFPHFPLVRYDDFTADPVIINRILGMPVRAGDIAGKRGLNMPRRIVNMRAVTTLFLTEKELDGISAALGPHAEIVEHFGYAVRPGGDLIEELSADETALAAAQRRRAEWAAAAAAEDPL